MMHHIIFCLMVAFASQRILILDQAEDIFGFDHHFKPLTNCSIDLELALSVRFFSNKTENFAVQELTEF